MVEKDIPEKFWEKYESLETIEREKKLKVIINNINKLFELKDNKLREHILGLTLMGYFDDLISYMHMKKFED